MGSILFERIAVLLCVGHEFNVPRRAGYPSCLPLATVNVQYNHYPLWQLTFSKVTVNMEMEIEAMN